MRVAAIDIGTVTSRLFVADVDQDGVKTVMRQCAITNLGEGVDATGYLSEEAIERTVSQVAQYRALVDECSADVPVDRLVALATSASRDAKNADVFVSRLRQVGVELTVIPGAREAELSFLGASNDFRGQDLLFSDIGGGSTELVFGRADAEPGQLVPQVSMADGFSFDIGCRRMTERFFVSDPPAPQEIQAAKAWAHEVLQPFFQNGHRCERVVAVAGTATSIVAVRDKLVPYDSSRVHDAVVTREEFEDVSQLLFGLPLEERMKLPGIQPKRAGVLPAGMVILGTVMDLAGVDEFTACESDILVGIVLDAVNQA